MKMYNFLFVQNISAIFESMTIIREGLPPQSKSEIQAISDTITHL